VEETPTGQLSLRTTWEDAMHMQIQEASESEASRIERDRDRLDRSMNLDLRLRGEW
jgi:hypothetical protein